MARPEIREDGTKFWRLSGVNRKIPENSWATRNYGPARLQGKEPGNDTFYSSIQPSLDGLYYQLGVYREDGPAVPTNDTVSNIYYSHLYKFLRTRKQR
jgi:hypothetical protein